MAQRPPLGAGQPASAARRISTQAFFETRTLLRNGEQLMVSILMPLAILFALGKTEVLDFDINGNSRLDFVVPGVMALAVMASAFTSQAISTGFDRRNGVLRFMSTTPLGKDGLLLAKVCAVLTIAVIQLVLVGLAALALGWQTSVLPLALSLVPVVLGALAFTAFALIVAGTFRAEAVIALANIILVALIVGGGVVVPAAQLPGWLAPIATYLPSGALGDCLRGVFLDGALPPLPLTVLTAWAVFLSYGAARLFKWH
ncbi:ABC transporter permease [Populibacterium corticicola]|uniref:Transport permease protein n=1 Tax=Populibacterium corticicola TaxID=1812826 RepID=A0ABW5XE70_9MICO